MTQIDNSLTPEESRLQAKLKEHRQQWKPEQGETLFGIYEGREAIFTQMGRQEIMLVRDKKGILNTFFATTTLKQLISTNNVYYGNWIAITFLGRKKCKSSDFEYNGYTLVVDRPPAYQHKKSKTKSIAYTG